MIPTFLQGHKVKKIIIIQKDDFGTQLQSEYDKGLFSSSGVAEGNCPKYTQISVQSACGNKNIV